MRRGVGRNYDRIDESMRARIALQPLYFVRSAPMSTEGHVNISPRSGMEIFSILDERQIAFVDLVGSGIETTEHLQEMAAS